MLRQILGKEVLDINQVEGEIHIFLISGDIIKVSAEQHGSYDPNLKIDIDYKNKYYE